MKLLHVLLIALLLIQLDVLPTRDSSPPEPSLEPAFAELDHRIEQNDTALQKLHKQTEVLRNALADLTARLHRTAVVPAVPRPVFPSPSHPQIQLAAFTPVSAELELDNLPEAEIFDGKTPDQYWQDLQYAASTRKSLQLDLKEREAFLEKGAALIQQLEETEANYQIDDESLQFLESRLEEEGITAVNAYFAAKKKLACYLAQAKQYRRALETMLRTESVMKLPKIRHSLPVQQRQQQHFYHLSLADNTVISDGSNFLIRIRFFYRENRDGIPTITQMNDTINLRTMRSHSQSFFYPQHVIREICQLTHQAWRSGALRFEGGLKETELQFFLSLICQ